MTLAIQRKHPMKKRWHLVLMLLIAAAALAYEAWSLGYDYVLPAFRDERGFIEDFQYYHDAAKQFCVNPNKLYEPFGRMDDFAFIYPPICILGFLPFALLPLDVSYLLWILAGYASMFAALYLAFGMLSSSGMHLRNKQLYAALVATAVTGPMFTNAASGNVNAVLLLLMMASAYFVYKGRACTGGVFLSLAIWLKVYPILLAPLLLLFAARRTRFVVGMIVGMVILPVMLFPVVPYSLYSQYVLEVLPNLSAHITLHAFNQSLAASIGRFFAPYSAASSWGYPDIPFATKATGYVAGFIALVVSIMIASRNSRRYLPVSSLLIVAVIPFVTPFGWGYVYVLSLPLFAYVLFVSLVLNNLSTKFITLAVFTMLLIPSWRLLPIDHLPTVSILFYMRYPAAVLLLFGVSVWTTFGQQSAALYRGSARRSTPESEP